jgi:hypothetical protein
MGLEDRFAIAQETPYSGNDLVHALPLSSLLREYARGNVTAGDALNAINAWVQTPLTTEEENDLDAIRTLIDAGANENSRVLIATQVGDVLVLGVVPTLGYTTRAELKAKIGF